MKQPILDDETQYKRMGKLMFPAMWDDLVITVEQTMLKSGINTYIDHPELPSKLAYTIAMLIERKARERNQSLKEIFKK